MKRTAPKLIAVLIGALGVSASGLYAQESAPQTAKTEAGDAKGKRIDRSTDRAPGNPSSSERESAEFDGLAPSSLSLAEKRQILEAVAPTARPMQSATLDDALSGTNFESGRDVLLPLAKSTLDGIVAKLKGKSNLRFQIVGHTDNQRIAARLKPVFPDNQALSEARALAVVNYLKVGLSLPASAFAASGKGETQPVASNGTPEGMAKNRRTEIHVWYEEAAPLPPPVPPKTVEKLVADDACAPNKAKPGLPFSISVDGKPLETDTKQVEADRQRCVDVALERADIQIKYDPLNVSPALNVWVPGSAVRGKAVDFGTYTNYAWWQKKAEIRVFVKGQNTQETPLVILPVAVGGTLQWQAPDHAPAELVYLLRVYDKDGRFDETASKPLRLLDQDVPPNDLDKPNREKLTGWGENSLSLKNIPASGGTVTVSGDKIKPDQRVNALGVDVPVDAKGKFAVRQILPAGPHSVEVSVKDAQGVGAVFRRNLSIADQDWFYMAVADITVGRDRTSGPAQLVTTDTQHYSNQTWIDGRGAFYLKGKIKGEYLLTASADTREQPLGDLFTNFQSKDPSYLLRRIDPDRYYPVYGDDATIVDDAPTQGKFYVKLEKGDSHVMWGNFKTAWTGTELTQYSRGLYGANAMWKSDAATSFGEKRSAVNLFVAEPGTLASREDFRGTGGSLYYLHNQDITQGSERVWVEIRDKDSGIVLQRTALTAVQDYEVNYLQGRITLRAPLPSTADGSSLVQSTTLNGNPVYLITTYEYTPGLTALRGSAMGLRASHWFTDGIRVGVTRYHQGESGNTQDLKGVDATLRYSAATWLKAEVARSSGVGSTNLSSITGGFSFNENTSTGQSAQAKRVEAAGDLSDLSPGLKGRISAYWQQQDAGFSGPGLSNPNGEGSSQRGVAAIVPVGSDTEVALKGDARDTATIGNRALEGAVRHKLDPEWGVSVGLRYDERYNGTTAAGTVSNASPTLSLNGARSDVIVRLDYHPLQEGELDRARLLAYEAEQRANAAKSASAAVAGGAATAAPPVTPGTTAGSGPASTLLPSAAATITPSATPTATGPVGQFDPALAAGVAAARMPGLKYEPYQLYWFAQDTITHTGDRPRNDRGGMGVSWQASNRLRLGAEASGGDGGAGGRLSGDYRIDDRSNVYLAYSMESESAETNYRGRQSSLAAGTRYRISDQVSTFEESRWAHTAGSQSLTHAFGVDLAPNDRWTTGLKFETGTLTDVVAGDLKRNAVGVTAAYKFERIKFATAWEYRVDRGTSLGTVAGTTSSPAAPGGLVETERRTWLTRNTLGYQVDPAWRLISKFNLSHSTSSQGAFYDGDYTEFVLGAAYRPVDNDRWNTLVKYTYFYNLPSPGQVDSLGSTLDYTQKSHVFDIDTTYDVRPWLSVGGKYGIRLGELRASKTDGDWFSSQADLVVLRADFHWVHEWDALVEARRLRAREAGDARSGFLVGVYRHVADHAKIGIGYNFTNFSDNLTDLSYRSRGWFLNAISTF